MLFYSKTYNYYKDKDYQNLGPKLRYGFKSSIEAGIYIGTFNMMFHNKPKNFAHLFYIFGKWVGLTAFAYTTHSALTYMVAKETNHDGPINHFVGALAPGLIAGAYFKRPFAVLITTVLFGTFAAHEKWKMQNFNTTFAFDSAFINGLGGLWEGQFSPETPLTRTFIRREDPGRSQEGKTMR